MADTSTTLTFLELPVNADEGFPQAFRLSFLDQMYQFFFYANVLDDGTPVPDDFIYDLPAPGAFLVLRVARESAAGPVSIFCRKLVRNLEYQAAELVLAFDEMKVSRKNLNNAGTFGSSVVGRIAAR
jgi:hypothetical protein